MKTNTILSKLKQRAKKENKQLFSQIPPPRVKTAEFSEDFVQLFTKMAADFSCSVDETAEMLNALLKHDEDPNQNS